MPLKTKRPRPTGALPRKEKEYIMKHTARAHANAAITAGLVSAMLAPSLLAPMTAIAQENAPANTNTTQTAHRASAAPTRGMASLLAAAAGQATMNADEARAALEQVKDTTEAAKKADAEQEQALRKRQQALNEAIERSQAANEQVSAELQTQIDTLKRELQQSLDHVTKLQQDKSNAETSLSKLDGALKDAELNAYDKKDALDKAAQQLKDAQAALDALGDNPTADEQAAYDAAKEEVDRAQAAHSTAQEALDEAVANLDALNAKLDELQGALKQAEQDLAVKREEASAAAAGLEAAQNAYQEALNQAGAASLEAAQQALANAQLAADAANQALASVQSQAEALPGQIEQIAQQINAEQDKVTQAQGAVDAATAKVASAQDAVAKAEAALGNLQGQQEAWDAAHAKAKQAVDAASAELATQQTELDEANRVVSELTQQVASLKQQIEDLKAQIGQNKKLAIDDFGGFLVWCMQTGNQSGRQGVNNAIMMLHGTVWNELEKGPDGLPHNPGHTILNTNIQMDGMWDGELFAGKFLYNFTNLNDPNDASSLENILKALDIIEEANKIRRNAGLEELKVTQDMMVVSILQTNWSRANLEANHVLDHAANTISKFNPSMSNGLNVAENLGAGYTPSGVVGAWYSEREIFQDLCRQHLGHEVSDAQAWDTFLATPALQEHGDEVGHYVNLLNPRFTVTGAAMTGSVTGQVYNYKNTFTDKAMSWPEANGDGGRYTVAEYRALIERSRDEGVNDPYATNPDGTGGTQTIKDQIAKLEQQLAGVESHLANANTAAQGHSADVKAARQALAQAQEQLAALGERPTDDSLQQALSKAQAELKAAGQAKAAAESELAATKNNVDATVAKLEKDKAHKQETLGKLQASLGALQKEAEAKNAELEAARTAASSVDAAHKALEKAQANKSASDKALASAESRVPELEAQVTQARKDADAAAKVVEAKQTELANNPGATAEQLERLQSTQNALDRARRQLAELTAKRDAANKAVELAEADKQAADKQVEQVRAQIAETQKALDDALAELPAAQEKANAWQQALAQQDAQSIVLNGFTGSVDNEDVSKALAAAHDAYMGKVKQLEAAQAHVADAQAAYDNALASKQATEQELAERLADLAMAQDAYDRIVASVAPAPNKSDAKGEAGKGLPQTGDISTALALAASAAGAMTLAGGMRRRKQQ